MEKDIIEAPFPAAGIKKSKPIDIIRFLKRYTVMIIVLGNFIFALIVPFAFLAIKPFYKVTCSIEINPVTQTIIGKDQENSILQQYSDYIKTQASRLRNHELLKSAIEILTPEDHNALFPPNIPIETAISILNSKLYIKPVSNTHLIELGIQGNSKEGLAPILNNIMLTYKKTMDTEQRNQNENRLQFLESERDALIKAIEKKINILRSIAKKTFTSEFSEAFNFFYKKAEQLQDANVKIALQLMDVESGYKQKLMEKDKISKLSMDSQVEEVVASDWGLDSTQSWTYQQLQDMRTMLDGLSKNSQDRIYIEQRMDAMRQYEKKMTDEVRQLAKKTVYGKRNYELEINLLQEQSRYDALKKASSDLSIKLETAKNEAAINSELMITGRQIQAELAHMRELLFKYESRINELGVQSKAPSRISIATTAYPPFTPAGNNAKKLLMVCLVFPYGLMGALFFGIEFLDNRITSPLNITHALGAPSTWPVARAGSDTPFDKITKNHPESLAAKALRSLAIRIYKDHRVNGSKIFLFNSVDEGSGNSDILLNVAHQLGELVPNVLIIEGVTSKPVLKDRLNAPDEYPDIGELLLQKQPSENILYVDEELRAKVIFAPEICCTYGGYDITKIFGDVIEDVARSFDLILIDSSPVMKNDFTEYLSVFTDVLVLIIHGNRTLYRDLRRVVELYIRHEMPAIIPVLNWGGSIRGAAPGIVSAILGRYENNFFIRYALKILNR